MGSQLKRVVSVSLGSPDGDFSRVVQMGDYQVSLVREGMNGDMARATFRLQELDGTVDALGLGGIDIYLYVAGKQFVIGDGLKLARAASRTPVVDGSGLKNTLERQVVRDLAGRGLIGPGTRVFVVSAMDRFGMAEALVGLGCDCVFGDLAFNIGIDYPLRSLAEVAELAEKYRSRLLTVPFHMLYPTGEKQLKRSADPRFKKYYDDADVIAGDRHLILRHLPDHITGKGIITTTTRPATMDQLRQAGASWIATTTPEMDGVSGGTNLIEAALVAVIGKRPEDLTTADYEEWIQRLGLRGAFHGFESLTGSQLEP